MPVKLVWTPQAREDVKQIYVDIAREQPRAAERYFQRFRQRPCFSLTNPAWVSAILKSIKPPGCLSRPLT
ncbi:MAG: type II toxin-antitoxin system RelE/ParE family toxin [Pararhizobium sp.]